MLGGPREATQDQLVIRRRRLETGDPFADPTARHAQGLSQLALAPGARATVNCREQRSTMLAWRDTPFTEIKTFPEEKCTVLFVRLPTMLGSRLVDDVGKPYNGP